VVEVTEVEAMNPITSLLFEELDRVHGLAGSVVLKRLAELGARIDKITAFTHRFEYQDDVDLKGVINIGASGKIAGITLAICLDGDAGGWSTWSKEREMQRLVLQEKWLKERGIAEGQKGSLRIGNCFSPQDGASDISIFPVNDCSGEESKMEGRLNHWRIQD
jgi:hypothetical protein